MESNGASSDAFKDFVQATAAELGEPDAAELAATLASAVSAGVELATLWQRSSARRRRRARFGGPESETAADKPRGVFASDALLDELKREGAVKMESDGLLDELASQARDRLADENNRLSKRLRALEELLAARERAHDLELGSASDTIARLMREEASYRFQLENLRAVIAEREPGIAELERGVDRLRKRVAELEALEERAKDAVRNDQLLRHSCDVWRTSFNELKGKTKQLEVENAGLVAKVAELTKARDELKAHFADREALIAELGVKLNDRHRELEALHAENQEEHEEHEALVAKVAELAKVRDELAAQLATESRFGDWQNEKLYGVDKDNVQLHERVTELEAQLEQRNAESIGLTREVSQLEGKLEHARARCHELEHSLKAARERTELERIGMLDANKRHTDELSRHTDTLRDLKQANERVQRLNVELTRAHARIAEVERELVRVTQELLVQANRVESASK